MCVYRIAHLKTPPSDRTPNRVLVDWLEHVAVCRLTRSPVLLLLCLLYFVTLNVVSVYGGQWPVFIVFFKLVAAAFRTEIINARTLINSRCTFAVYREPINRIDFIPVVYRVFLEVAPKSVFIVHSRFRGFAWLVRYKKYLIRVVFVKPW